MDNRKNILYPFIYICILTSSFVHLFILALVFLKLEMYGDFSLLQINKLNYYIEKLNYIFHYMCIVFMAILAIILIAKKISLKQYIYFHGAFWNIQIFGGMVFHIIIQFISEYSDMDLFGRLVHLLNSDIYAYLLVFSILIRCTIDIVTLLIKRIHDYLSK